MKQLTTSAGVFGPFNEVERLDDRWKADGADLPFTVVGAIGAVDDWSGPLPEAPAPLEVVPDFVTMRQARRALLGAGLLGAVEAAIASLPSPHKEAASIDWNFSNEVQRNNGLVAQLAPALGLTDAQLDDLFIAASKIN